MEPEAIILFPPFRLDLVNERLWREQRAVPLRPKTFALLRYLAEHGGRLVSKEELLRAIWGDTYVSEEGLRDYLREIRSALGDNAAAPQFVETVRGRGYRFLPSITIPPVSSFKFQVPSSAPSPTPTTQLLVPSEALPFPDKPSIVVLPFVNMSGDPAQEPFSDGLTEELTTAFSRLSRAFVISRQSAFSYKGKAVKAPEMSQELRVQYVLSGSVRKSDDRLRVCVHLVDAITDEHLWSERYELSLKDSFTLQDEIVQRILTALNSRFALLLMLSENSSFPSGDGAEQ